MSNLELFILFGGIFVVLGILTYPVFLFAYNRMKLWIWYIYAAIWWITGIPFAVISGMNLIRILNL